MSYLSRLSLANRSIVALATIAILLFGAVAIPSLKEDLYPSLSFPAISIIAQYNGASPSIVEQDVTDPLEQSIQGVQGIQQTSSTSSEGSSSIIVEYNYGTDLTTASQTLTQQIAKVQASLPSGVTPQVETFDISNQPVIQLAVTSTQDNATLATNLQNIVVPALQGINGVASVNVTGERNQIVTVTLDATKLKNEGLTTTQVQAALEADNTIVPAGELNTNGQSLAIRVGNTLGSLNDLKNLIVGEHSSQQSAICSELSAAAASGRALSSSEAAAEASCASAAASATPVKLSDVATVAQTLAPSTTLTRTNGKDSLGVSITKSDSGNTVSISQAVNQQIASLQQKMGGNTKIAVISDQGPTITSAIQSLEREALIGAIFAILVILFFLFSIRSTLVTAISIPLSIVIALIGLWLGNYTLNLFTLGGLTIAIGRVVDDSIVVLENIYRHLNQGEEKRVAIPAAVKEVAGAVTASTLTTVAVFLPIAFVGGLIGEVFSPFSVAVTIALLASLFVALTIIPVLAFWFLKTNTKTIQQSVGAHENSILERGYIPLIRWVTSHTAVTIIASCLLFVASLTLITHLGTNLFSSQQQNSFTISQTLPVGTDLTTTNNAAAKVETVLKGVPHIQFYQVTVGSGGSGGRGFGGGGAAYNTASFSITADSTANEANVQQTVQDRLKTLTGVGTLQVAASAGGFNSSSIEVDVQATNTNTLQQAAQQVLSAVQSVPNLTNVSSNLADASPLVNVTVDSQKAEAYGLTASQVGLDVREVYTGATATTVTINGTQENVNIVLGSQPSSITALQNLLIPTQTGSVKLSAIATVAQGTGPTQITHNNGTRTATISATSTSSNTGGVSSAIQKKLKTLSLPAGASYSLGGVTSTQASAFSGLEDALLAAIALVYIIMVGTFRSLVQPLILLVSIPFAAVGSIFLLFITNTPLGLPALIGLLMLVGIVVTNAIVLLDLVHQYRARGLDARSAVIEGGRRRLRPILMTAIATVLALTPMALGVSQSSGFISAPLAVTVIGGLISSTVLTLLLVPTLYVLVEGRKDKQVRQKPVESLDTAKQLVAQD